MDRKQFKEFQTHGLTLPQRVEVNVFLSLTDPTQAITVGNFVKSSTLGLPVPQLSEVSVVYNNVPCEDVSIIERSHIDKFDVAVESRRQMHKVKSKKSVKPVKSKENES